MGQLELAHQSQSTRLHSSGAGATGGEQHLVQLLPRFHGISAHTRRRDDHTVYNLRGPTITFTIMRVANWRETV